jgi:hypothetical protein
VGGGFAELVTGLPPSTFAFVLRRSTSFLRLAFYPSFTDCAGISRLMAKRAQLAQLEQGGEHGIEVSFSAGVQDMELQPEGAGRRLQVSQL